MTTTRTVRAEQPGPIVLDVDTQSTTLNVTVDPNRSYAELTLRTLDGTGPSADAVNDAAAWANGDQIACKVRYSGGGGVFIAGNNYSNVVIGSGTVMVNGRVVSGGGASPIEMAARVPAGSSVRFGSQSGDLEASGPLRAVKADTQSGDISVGAVGEMQASTQSGDVSVGQLAGYAELKTMSGDVAVHGLPGSTCRAATMSGDVRGSGSVRLDGSSMSGRVRNR
jgi:hypothetical protein